MKRRLRYIAGSCHSAHGHRSEIRSAHPPGTAGNRHRQLRVRAPRLAVMGEELKETQAVLKRALEHPPAVRSTPFPKS